MSAYRIALEPFDAADIDQLLSWLRTESDLIQWAGAAMNFPLTRAQLVKYFDNTQRNHGTHYVYRVREQQSNHIIGHCGLSSISRAHRSCRLSRILIGDREHRGKGYGQDMVRQLLAIAFNELKLHRVELDVFDFNTAAIRCYERCGFIREGLRRDAARCGDNYWNSIVMGCLSSELKSI
ncbi:MAG: GNAT family protein [Steroidobacter sp.]